MVKLYASKGNLEIVVPELLTTNAINAYEVEIEFDDDWDGFSRTAVFYQIQRGKRYSIVLVDGRALFPADLLRVNLPVYVGVEGSKDGVRKTTDFVKLEIAEGAKTSDTTSFIRTMEDKVSFLRLNHEILEYSVDGKTWFTVRGQADGTRLFVNGVEVPMEVYGNTLFTDDTLVYEREKLRIADEIIAKINKIAEIESKVQTAEENASKAVDDSKDAKTSASNALSTATVAKEQAKTAEQTANIANENAGNALSQASSAKTEAQTAVTTANEAKSKADEALSSIPDTSTFITKTVNDLTNYYTKTQIDGTVTDLENKISAIPKFSIKVVDNLPTTNISATTVYLVKSTTTSTNDLYNEYIYVGGTWERIGAQTLDLTGYATQEWVGEQIADFLTEEQVNALITASLATVKNDVKTLTESVDTLNERVDTLTAKDRELESKIAKKANESDLAAIAKSGKLSDAAQDKTHRTVTDSEKTEWSGKQDQLTFDETPTADSKNPITSGGVKKAFDDFVGGVPTIKQGQGNKAEVFNDASAEQAAGEYSHTEGIYGYADAAYSHVEGWGNKTENVQGSHAEGRYNDRTVFSSNFPPEHRAISTVGIGTGNSDEERKNGLVVRLNGAVEGGMDETTFEKYTKGYSVEYQYDETTKRTATVKVNEKTLIPYGWAKPKFDNLEEGIEDVRNADILVFDGYFNVLGTDADGVPTVDVYVNVNSGEGKKNYYVPNGVLVYCKSFQHKEFCPALFESVESFKYRIISNDINVEYTQIIFADNKKVSVTPNGNSPVIMSALRNRQAFTITGTIKVGDTTEQISRTILFERCPNPYIGALNVTSAEDVDFANLTEVFDTTDFNTPCRLTTHDVTVSGLQYVWFCSPQKIKFVTCNGFKVPLADAEEKTTEDDDLYYCYRTFDRLADGTYTFIVTIDETTEE